jgi:uncharacterized protein HemX
MPAQTDKPDEKSGLQKILDSVAGSGEGGSPSSWPVTLFFLSLFVIILAVLGIKMALTKRAAAETARKLRKQLEDERQAKENAKLADNETARRDAQEVIKDIETQITELKSEMGARQVMHEEYVKELSSISSWDQLVVVDARDPKP